MDDKRTPLPVLVLMGAWLAVVFTGLAWLRATDEPRWWGWVLVVAIAVPGIVVAVIYERRRQRKPDEHVEVPDSRSFADLPSIQKTRLIVSTVSSALIVLVFGALIVIGAARGKAGPTDWLLLALPALAVLVTAWLWWRLLHPNRRMAQQEQRIRGQHSATVFLPVALIIPAQAAGAIAFHIGSSAPLHLAIAFLGNAVLAAVLLAVSERMRKKASTEDRSPTPVW